MPNNTPIGNIDFVNPLELMSALQRNPQVASLICTGAITTSFSASTIYAILADGGTVYVADITKRYTVGNAAQVGMPPPFIAPFGAPTNYGPPGGACFAVLGSTGNNVTIIYK